jgi:hypothetical protein
MARKIHHNPDLYLKGALVCASEKARIQGIGGDCGIVISRYPKDQRVTVRWCGRHGEERWHVDLLDRLEKYNAQ